MSMNPQGPEIDMTLDGRFTRPPQPGPGANGPFAGGPFAGTPFAGADPRRPLRAPLALRLGVWAVLIAVFAGGIAAAALALWLALAMIPVAIVAGLVGYGVLRFQAWKARRSVGGQTGLFRP